MSTDAYIRTTDEEKQILEKARERRFGEGRRVTLGAFARILAEQSLDGENHG